MTIEEIREALQQRGMAQTVAMEGSQMKLGPRIPAHLLRQALENLHGAETSTVELEQQIQDQWLGSEARAAEARSPLADSAACCPALAAVANQSHQGATS